MCSSSCGQLAKACCTALGTVFWVRGDIYLTIRKILFLLQLSLHFKVSDVKSVWCSPAERHLHSTASKVGVEQEWGWWHQAVCNGIQKLQGKKVPRPQTFCPHYLLEESSCVCFIGKKIAPQLCHSAQTKSMPGTVLTVK